MNNEVTDLFEHWELIPQNVVEVLETCYDGKNENIGYKELEQLQKKLNLIGYTLDYGLDAQPFDLRKIKEYNLDILTEQGPKTVFFTDLQPIEETEKAIVLKYGTFTTLKCTQL